MQTAQSRITEARAASREAGARYLILLAAGISFVLSVTLWFGGHELPGHLRRALGAVDPLARRDRAEARAAMSAVGLFAIGLAVTLIVGAALGLLVYGAILDEPRPTRRSATPTRRLPRRPASSPAHRPAA